MNESSDEDCNITTLEIKVEVSDVELDFLPEKSREKYLKAYELFNEWRYGKGERTCSEAVVLSYFMELSQTRQPTTLWSIYSMLKATLKTKRDVHIENYPKLMAFLKSKSEEDKSKKVFSAHEIERFINEAPDDDFLATKVGLIIGISGACRTSELLGLSTNNVVRHSDRLLLVNLPNVETDTQRSFVIRDEYVNIIDKYMALRPANTENNRLFLQYKNHKCSTRPMGVKTIGGLPRDIATFLNLQEPHLYTGHCFRRTSASLLADSRKSSTRTEEHIEVSIENTVNNLPLETLQAVFMQVFFYYIVFDIVIGSHKYK